MAQFPVGGGMTQTSVMYVCSVVLNGLVDMRVMKSSTC